MGGDAITPEQLEALSRLPARDVLHSQLVGMIASPITGLVRGLNALISGLAIQLGQIRDQGLVGGDEPAAEAAPAEDASPAGETAAEKPAAEDTPAEEPAAEEPAAEEPVAEVPAAEEPDEGIAEEVVPPEEPAEEPSADEVEEGEGPEAEAEEDEPEGDEDAEGETAPAPATRRRGSAETSTGTRRAAPPRPDGDVVARARSKYVRSAPRKARLVMDNIRGKEVEQARAILVHAPRAVAEDILKLLNSAVANAESNYELGPDELRVRKAFVDEGPTIKRFRPRALGRATRIQKRTSHMTIELTTTGNGR
jgi:ribosomal protein L22